MARHIKYTPEGRDLTKGMAQTRLCHSIAEYMLEADDNEAMNPRIIGLQGKWGSGKSNVIQLLKNSEELQGKYHFVEYDTWGHQEDQHRQSLMDYLTKDLTNHHILPAEIEIGNTVLSWTDFLTHILSRKSRQESFYHPQLPDSIRWMIIAFITSTFLNLFIAYFDDNPQTHFVRLVMTALPWMVYGVYFLWHRDSFDDLLLLFDKNYRSGKTVTSLYTHEPSATDFREWMQAIAQHSTYPLLSLLISALCLMNSSARPLVLTTRRRPSSIWPVSFTDSTLRMPDKY